MRDLTQERPQAVRVLMLYPAGSPLKPQLDEYFINEERFPIVLIASTDSPERCRSLVREVFAHVVLMVDVAPDEPNWSTRLLQLSKDINLDYQTVTTVVLTDVPPENMTAYYEKALLAGARGVINVGRLGEGMVGAFSEVERTVLQSFQFIRHNSENDARQMGLDVRVMTVTSGKGGTGKSTLATAVAGEIARRRLDKRVMLLDFDTQFGSLAAMLKEKPQRTLAQMASLSLADIANLQTFADIRDLVEIVNVGGGAELYFLPAPFTTLESFALKPESASEILSTFRRIFDYTVIDVPSQITDASLAAYQASELLLLVCEPEMLAVRACRQLTQLLQDPTIGNPAATIKVVLNKVWGKREARLLGEPLVTPADVEKLFPEAVIGQLPFDADFVNDHISSGRPIGSMEHKAQFLADMRNLVNNLGLDLNPPARAQAASKPAPAARGGLLSRLRSA